MAAHPGAVPTDDAALGMYGFEERSLPSRILHNIVTFSKRKPLGAFGAVLLLGPMLASLVLSGMDLGIVTLPHLLPYHHNDYQVGQNVLEGPSSSHWFGTDHFGRDLFSRLLYGARLSYLIGGSAFVISTVLSTTLSIVSAYYIRTVDLVLQRVIEIVGFLPDLIVIITLFSIYGATPLTLILTLGVLNGINTGRVLRSIVIGVKGQPYIEAAKSIGANDRRVIMRHILPQVGFWIIHSATSGIAIAILVESGLALLGFGLDPHFPTLGNLLNNSREYLRAAPHLALFPGLTIFALLLGARLFGDALRDVLDPRLRGQGR